MARPKKIQPEDVIDSGFAISVPESKVEPLTQEFNHISEMNILRDKINEIIKHIQG